MTKASIGRVRKAQLTYGNVCTLSGCNQPRKSGHKWCALHKRRSIYRGSPQQSKINIRDINFSRKTVLFLIKDNQNNPAWHDLMTAIQSNWDAGVRAVNQELLLSANGLAMNRYRRNGLRICSAIFGATGMKLYTQLERRAQRLIQNNLDINKAIKNIQ